MIKLAELLGEKATFTSKYDDSPKLKGKQTELPDELQAKLVKEDHEVSMAQASLKSIIKSSAQLMSKLGNMERDIPGWIQDHITNAENYIDQAAQGFHELDYDKETYSQIQELFGFGKKNQPINQSTSDPGLNIISPEYRMEPKSKPKDSLEDLMIKKQALDILVPNIINMYDFENSTVEELKALLAKHKPKPVDFSKFKYKIQLVVDGKIVLEKPTDEEPTLPFLIKLFKFLKSEYSSKYNFSKAEIVILDKNKREVASFNPKNLTSKNDFIDKKATYMGMGGGEYNGAV
jgi:hypothetical protein